jgi:glycolate oxidase iron-sulfur subunit
MPSVSKEFFDQTIAEVVPARGERKGRVAFLSGCIMNVAFAEVHHDAVELLTKLGYEVVIPKDQQCCGSLHGHYGMKEDAKILARKNIELFQQYDFDALIVDASGCSAFLKEYGTLLADDTAFAARARAFSEKVKDSMEFFPSIGMNAHMTSLEKCVTYHEACHLVHTQKISQQPRALLQSIPGSQFVELPEAAWCCGSAGIYNVVRTEDSMKFLKRKIDNLASTGADIVMTSNPGCHLQLQQGIKQRGLAMEVHHPVSVLNKIIS